VTDTNLEHTPERLMSKLEAVAAAAGGDYDGFDAELGTAT
jgi:hypothetical protein